MSLDKVYNSKENSTQSPSLSRTTYTFSSPRLHMAEEYSSAHNMGPSQEQSVVDSRESSIPRNLATSQIFIPTNDLERPVMNSADFDTFEIPASRIFDASERTSYEIQFDAPTRDSERRTSAATAPTKKHGFICRIQRLFRACLPTSGKRSSTYKTSPSSKHSSYLTAN